MRDLRQVCERVHRAPLVRIAVAGGSLDARPAWVVPRRGASERASIGARPRAGVSHLPHSLQGGRCEDGLHNTGDFEEDEDAAHGCGGADAHGDASGAQGKHASLVRAGHPVSRQTDARHCKKDKDGLRARYEPHDRNRLQPAASAARHNDVWAHIPRGKQAQRDGKYPDSRGSEVRGESGEGEHEAHQGLRVSRELDKVTL
jgi:hypothetical protein